MKTKITVHTKTGKKLVYYTEDSGVQEKWSLFLLNQEGSVQFGRFVAPKENIDYVEFD